jgi:cell wall-associated NlpC family hydrolase
LTCTDGDFGTHKYNHGPHVFASAPLLPGDLLLYGPSTSAIDHVGIYVGNGTIVNAPHTGTVVRYETAAGAGAYQGATRPAVGHSGQGPLI